jgi:hypothetical protein
MGRTAFLLGLCLMGASPAAHAVRWRSTETQVSVIELYSSEGCSSCPPADAWVSTLRRAPNLWKEFVPVTFHVDYWNRLGWYDRFSRDAFTRRQRQYAAQWGIRQIYTPGFVLDGTEWKAGAIGSSAPAPTGRKPGVLETSTTDGRRIEASFTPTEKGGEWSVTAALLGNGLETKVTSGENGGKVLRHDFVVLQIDSQPMTAKGSAFTGTVTLSDPAVAAKALSLAVWVSRTPGQSPVQAVGGDLPDFPKR